MLSLHGPTCACEAQHSEASQRCRWESGGGRFPKILGPQVGNQSREMSLLSVSRVTALAAPLHPAPLPPLPNEQRVRTIGHVFPRTSP